MEKMKKKWRKKYKKWLRRLNKIAKNKGKSKQITITAEITRVMRAV